MIISSTYNELEQDRYFTWFRDNEKHPYIYLAAIRRAILQPSRYFTAIRRSILQPYICIAAIRPAILQSYIYLAAIRNYILQSYIYLAAIRQDILQPYIYQTLIRHVTDKKSNFLFAISSIKLKQSSNNNAYCNVELISVSQFKFNTETPTQVRNELLGIHRAISK